MSDAVSSTIGEQRRRNYALQPRSEDAFVQVVTQGQSVASLYFAYTTDSNRRRATCSTTPSLSQVVHPTDGRCLAAGEAEGVDGGDRADERGESGAEAEALVVGMGADGERGGDRRWRVERGWPAGHRSAAGAGAARAPSGWACKVTELIFPVHGRLT